MGLCRMSTVVRLAQAWADPPYGSPMTGTSWVRIS